MRVSVSLVLLVCGGGGRHYQVKLDEAKEQEKKEKEARAVSKQAQQIRCRNLQKINLDRWNKSPFGARGRPFPTTPIFDPLPRTADRMHKLAHVNLASVLPRSVPGGLAGVRCVGDVWV